MPVFVLFLSGIILFYLALFFPFTASVLFILLSLFIVRGAARNKDSNYNTSPLMGGDKGEGENSIILSQPPQSAEPVTPAKAEIREDTGPQIPRSESRAGRSGKTNCNLRGIIRLRNLSFPLLIILGFTYASFRYTPLPDLSGLSNREIIMGCVTDSSPRKLPGGRFLNEVRIDSVKDAGTGRYLTVLHGREMSIISDEGLPRGIRYMLAATTGKDMERRDPGMIRGDNLYGYLDEVRSAEPVKVNPFQTWFQDSREGLNRYLKENFGSDTAALLASLTTGERSTMSGEIKDAFNTTGLVHLLSISGTHFGLFSALIFGVFRLIIRSMPFRYLQRFTMYLSPSQAAAIISLPFMLFYLALSGASIPAVRSFIMINTFLLGLLIGRKGFWLNSLLFAAFLICIGDPSAVLSISFQLSFLAVLFIGYFLGERRDRPGPQGLSARLLGIFRGTLMLTLAALLGTAPLAAYYFHYFSLISPISNLVITPFIGFILVPLSLISSFVFIFSGHYPFHSLVAVFSDAALIGVKSFASIPYADIKIPAFPLVVTVLFYTGLITYFLSGRKRLALALPVASVLLCLVSAVYGKNAVAVTYLDVGQGDSAVVEGYGGKTMVIDTGRTGRELDAYLRYLGKRTIDALVITHADDDHAGGAGHVVKTFHVKEVWDSGLITYPDALFGNTLHRSLERGDEVTAQGLTVQVLHPYKGFFTLADDEAVSENNDSLVLKIAGRRSFLFTADTAGEAEEDMCHLGRWLKSDVIKVSHHGSRTSSAEDFLAMVSPVIGVISVGRDNPYGHPHYETLERLQGVKIYRTDRDGAVKITETKGGLTVKTYRELVFERTRSPSGEWRNIRRLFARW